MNEKIKTDGIIFDIDGTLWDSTHSVATAWNKLLDTRSDVAFRATPDKLKKVFGNPLPVIASIIFPELTPEDQVDLINECNEYEHQGLLEEAGILYPEVRETILLLKEKYSLYIVSNCEEGYIETFLQVTGLENCFKDHLCPGDTGKYKAENLKIIVERNHITHPVYLGDTQGDSDACREAGIPFVRAGYGFGDPKNYAARIEHFADFANLVETL